jgi:hypothetical protein
LDDSIRPLTTARIEGKVDHRFGEIKMKIPRIEINPVTIRYKKPNSVRAGRFTLAGHHVILKVFTDQGIVGLGEGPIGRS